MEKGGRNDRQNPKRDENKKVQKKEILSEISTLRDTRAHGKMVQQLSRSDKHAGAGHTPYSEEEERWHELVREYRQDAHTVGRNNVRTEGHIDTLTFQQEDHTCETKNTLQVLLNVRTSKREGPQGGQIMEFEGELALGQLTNATQYTRETKCTSEEGRTTCLTRTGPLGDKRLWWSMGEEDRHKLVNSPDLKQQGRAEVVRT